MTAEVEEVDNKSQKEVVAENESKSKDSTPKDENAPQNGGGDVKKIEDEDETPPADEKPTETEGEGQQAEEEPEPVVVKKRAPRFWERLFRRGNSAKQQDLEAGTELLAKDKKDKVEIKGEDKEKDANKTEKNDTEITIPLTDDAEANGDAAKDGKVREETPKKAYWKRVAISLGFIIAVLIVVSIISILTSSGYTSRGPLGDPLAITDCGPVHGYKENDIYVFKGIPYALPPKGELRWKPPMQAANLNDCWTDTYEAYNSSAICYQKPIPGYNVEMSEDCLYLDIVTPSLSPPVLRPVVVYIPGDHPMQGYSAADFKWRPTTTLADEKDVTFVTINYRTNVFGFMALNLLTERMRPPTSGNYGIMDMIAALKWVQRNIRSFGGDPEKVTVLAHGGTATAGLALLSTKKSDGLFNQMWLASPSAHFSNKSLDEVGVENAAFLTKLNCNSLDCLYNKTTEEILAAIPGFWNSDWSNDLPSAEEEHSPVMAVSDGVILYDTPYNMWDAGDIQKVSVVIGSAAQESGSSKLLPYLEKWSWEDFSAYVKEKLETINDNATITALQFYIKNSSTPLQQYHTMVSDIRTICPLERLNEALSDAIPDHSYWYLVDFKPSSPIQFSNDSAAVQLSVHGLDIVAIFGLMEEYMGSLSPKDITFQKNMQELFFSFVKNGQPNINKEPLMASNFINIIGDVVRSRMTPYENCHLWNNDVFYPKYAKVN